MSALTLERLIGSKGLAYSIHFLFELLTAARLEAHVRQERNAQTEGLGFGRAGLGQVGKVHGGAVIDRLEGPAGVEVAGSGGRRGRRGVLGARALVGSVNGEAPGLEIGRQAASEL